MYAKIARLPIIFDDRGRGRAPGTHFVDFWKQGEKVLKSRLLEFILSKHAQDHILNACMDFFLGRSFSDGPLSPQGSSARSALRAIGHSTIIWRSVRERR